MRSVDFLLRSFAIYREQRMGQELEGEVSKKCFVGFLFRWEKL